MNDDQIKEIEKKIEDQKKMAKVKINKTILNRYAKLTLLLPAYGGIVILAHYIIFK